MTRSVHGFFAVFPGLMADHELERSCFGMDTTQIVTLLVAERDRLNRAIEALQGPVRRRGRPPKNAVMPAPSPSLVEDNVAPKGARRPRTAAQKKA